MILPPLRREEGSIGSTGTKAVSPLSTIIQNWTERFWHLLIGVTCTAHDPGKLYLEILKICLYVKIVACLMKTILCQNPWVAANTCLSLI